jgi:hypothetical protein
MQITAPGSLSEPWLSVLQDRRLCIDHKHGAEKPRGLLCHNCNTALGLLGDNVNSILGLSQYLARSEPLEM